jgi:hypothetical protein
MDKQSLTDSLIAALILLERTKGWKRRALASFYLLIALAVGAYGWHSLCLWRLPNAPEPFDLAKYGRVAVADADNSIVAYREVFAKLGDFRVVDYKVWTGGAITSRFGIGEIRIGRERRNSRGRCDACHLPLPRRSRGLVNYHRSWSVTPGICHLKTIVRWPKSSGRIMARTNRRSRLGPITHKRLGGSR